MIARWWQKKWFRGFSYCAWFSLVFVVSLVLTFPSAALVAAVEAQVAKAAPALGDLSIDQASLRLGFSGPGVRLQGVTFSAGASEQMPWSLDAVGVALKGFSFDPKNPAFEIGVDAYGGRADLSIDGLAVRAEVVEMDLAKLTPLHLAMGLGLGGKLSGDVDLTLGAKTVARTTGSINLTLSAATLGPGKMPIPGFGSELSIPTATLGDVPIKLTLAKSKADLAPLKVTGGDIELAAEGRATLRRRLKHAGLDLRLDFRPTKALGKTKEGKNLLNILDKKSPLLPRMVKRKINKKGWMGMAVTGRLSKPSFRLRTSRQK
jgi:type II secretion system protein N